MNNLNKIRGKLGVKTIGAIYVWIGLIILFTILEPSLFFSYATVKQILNEYAVTGLIALGLLLPLSAGVYDLSVGAVAGLSSIGAAWSLGHITANPWVALLVGLVMALAFGGINIIVVIVMRVDSFIGTLATSSICTAIVTAISGGNILITNTGGAFQRDFGIKNVFGLTFPVGLMLVAMLILSFFLEKTGFGRRLYATGYETEVARLGGVPVNRLRCYALLGSAFLAGLAGVCEAASIGAGDPTVGPSFLLPAFAAAFLGATQFRGGRFNAWGAVVATLLLGTGDVGLILVGAPSWSPAIFEGIVLIVAVSLTHADDLHPLRSIRDRIDRNRARPAQPAAANPPAVTAPTAGESA